MIKSQTKKITFEEYLNYDDSTNKCYELVDGNLVEMPPASFLHSDIVDFIADCFKAIAKEYKLDVKVKTGDVGVRTGINSARIPDIAVIEGSVWQSMPRDASAVIQDSLLLAVEVVSTGTAQISSDYIEKVAEYEQTGIAEYWIVDPTEHKITVMILNNGSYSKTVFTGSDLIYSAIFTQLQVSVVEVLEA